MEDYSKKPRFEVAVLKILCICAARYYEVMRCSAEWPLAREDASPPIVFITSSSIIMYLYLRSKISVYKYYF